MYFAPNRGKRADAARGAQRPELFRRAGSRTHRRAAATPDAPEREDDDAGEHARESGGDSDTASPVGRALFRALQRHRRNSEHAASPWKRVTIAGGDIRWQNHDSAVWAQRLHGAFQRAQSETCVACQCRGTLCRETQPNRGTGRERASWCGAIRIAAGEQATQRQRQERRTARKQRRTTEVTVARGHHRHSTVIPRERSAFDPAVSPCRRQCKLERAFRSGKAASPRPPRFSRASSCAADETQFEGFEGLGAAVAEAVNGKRDAQAE
jgi:hypothetical protein